MELNEKLGPIIMPDRLFVPLKTEHYEAFESGEKTWELRGLNSRFNVETVQVGREVELRRGYNTDDSLWGEIVEVDYINDINEVGYYKEIVPGYTKAEFIHSVDEMMAQYSKYLAFKVDIYDD